MAQRIIFPERGRVELQAVNLPDPGAEDLLVATQYSLISIGTETRILHQRYAPGTHFDRIFSFPQLKTGVQAVGTVQACGESVENFSPGETVYMRMAHGSHQLLPEQDCSPVPAGLDLENACWAGLAKTAYRAAWAGDFDGADSVLIIGGGPVGQMVVRWAKAMNVGKVVVCDPDSSRLALAAAGGATECLEGILGDCVAAVSDLWDRGGSPLVVDSTGIASVFADALSVTGRFGKLILLGDTGYPGEQCLTSDVMSKGLTIQAVHDSHDVDGWTQRRIDALFFGLAASAAFPLDGLVTHRFQPRECEQAYATASRGAPGTMGILFDWTS